MAIKKKSVKKKVATRKRVVKKRAAAKKPIHPLMLNGQSWDIPKVCEFVFDRLATSDDGLGEILSDGFEGKNLPSYSTIMKWVADDEKLSEMYARAREGQMDWLQHNMKNTAMDLALQPIMIDNMPLVVNGEIVKTVSQPGVQLARLITDNMKWTMAKLSPRKYGDKVAIGGADDLPAIKTEPTLTKEQAIALLKNNGLAS
ncbi:MAG: hypothetical protein KAR42_15670 [candidate division Zixibacteria bacterium]|nr:hypothetical protein [candidate division Zixibacteria bacterium]